MERSHTVQSSLSHGSKAHAPSTTIPGNARNPSCMRELPVCDLVSGGSYDIDGAQSVLCGNAAQRGR